ncbi:hypothetical protein J2W56_005500 [Nocardia kruczakiae]|uniref:Uncharacterized protein n=1 Tax=Nocardia kruczakiae TaxID=261477 RepID=A0ABU1XN14_9NOCA|nr:hypothetical protein [Nocardia kruczakiae]MDR7171739.1 hypothetical protein [Nocardia kruczakiae]
MYEQLTARLDESYTRLGTTEQVTRIREHVFTAVPPAECNHYDGETICADCADGWQIDYEFDDPFPFPRNQNRWTLRDLIDAGKLEVGQSLTVPGSDITAIVTSTGGLMLRDGRVFANSSAAANAALAPDNPTDNR